MNNKDGKSWTSSKEPRGRGLELGEVWQLLRSNVRLITAGAVLMIVVVGVVTLRSHMGFRARGSLYLGELQRKNVTPGTGPEPWDFLGGGNGDVGTEVEILRSRDLIKQAILDSGLNVAISPIDTEAPRYLRWRLARRDLRSLDAGVRHLMATGASLADSSARGEAFRVTYIGENMFDVWKRDQRLGRGAFGKEFEGGGLKATFIPGPDGPPPQGAIYDVGILPIDDVADEVARGLNVTSAKTPVGSDGVKVVSVDFLHRSPRAAARFVDTLMRDYLDRRQSWKSDEATRAETFAVAQARGMKDALDESEKKLADYRKNSAVVGLSDEAKGMIEQLGKYEEQRIAARLQMASFGSIQELLKNDHAPIEQFLVGEKDDPVLAGLSSNLAQAQQELRRVEERFTPDAPAAQEQKAQVAGQLGVVKNYILARSTRARRQLESLDGMIGQFEKKLKLVPGAQLDLAQLTRNSDVLSRMYSTLLERQEQASVAKASTMSRNRILDAAEVPHREDSPAALIRLSVALVLGMLLAALAVVLRRLLSPSFQTVDEVRRWLGEMPILAAVPAADGRRGPPGPRWDWRKWRERFRPAPFRGGGTSALADAFRYLRTNLYYGAGSAQQTQVLLLTSPNVDDGKTTCTRGLATALAADGKRVLVVDADLRGTSGEDSRQSSPPGLSAILSGTVTWKAAVRSVAADGVSFHRIAAGKPPARPAELLSSAAFGQLITSVRTHYDFILVDSPPFPLVPDALIALAHVDRVLTVLRLQKTHRRFAEEHLRRLSSEAARCGVIINGVEPTAIDGAYYLGYAPHAVADRLPGAERARAPA